MEWGNSHAAHAVNDHIHRQELGADADSTVVEAQQIRM
jgi:hypothetical protein